MNIGANIKAKRLEKNMTQRELAELVGVDQSMICQMERGTKTPSLPLSVELAAALGCRLEALCEAGEGRPPWS